MNSATTIVFVAVLIGLTFLPSSTAMDQSELQLYDLVEEVKDNFYDLVGVSKTASAAEIRRAFRKLSVKIHPDKNPDDPNAQEKFRKLNGVYEVLKDEELRKKYDHILEFGLPDWRQPIYYYRKLRKMSLTEAFLLFLILFTVCHYCVLWGFYFENKLNFEDFIRKKSKKRQKELSSAITEIESPKLTDIFPIAFSRFCITFVKNLPENCRCLLFEAKSKVQEELDKRKEAEKVAAEEKEAESRRLELKELKKKRKAAAAAAAAQLPRIDIANITPVFCNIQESENGHVPVGDLPLKQGEWTDDEILLLIRAVKRFPGGTASRWEKVAAMVNRSVADVTQKAKEVQDKGLKEPQQHTQLIASFDVNVNSMCGDSDDMDSEDDEYASKNARRRKKKANKTVKKTHENSDEETAAAQKSVWTQEQQSHLEKALRECPKGVSDRWIKVADLVPGKTAEECSHRFKELAEKIRLKKA